MDWLYIGLVRGCACFNESEFIASTRPENFDFAGTALASETSRDARNPDSSAMRSGSLSVWNSNT